MGEDDSKETVLITPTFIKLFKALCLVVMIHMAFRLMSGIMLLIYIYIHMHK